MAASVVSDTDNIGADSFFLLVDDVLREVGREPLVPGGAPQRAIEVASDDRVLQILAGPGSGKTEVLIWRILYELFVTGTPSHRLLVTTFTRKAATELSIRAVERADLFAIKAREHGLHPRDPHIHDLRVGTIHSLCDELLAEFDDQYMSAGTQLIDEVEARVHMTRTYRWGFTHDGGPLIARVLQRPELSALFRLPWDVSPDWPRSVFERVSYLQMLIAQQTETWLPRGGLTDPKLNGAEVIHKIPGLTNDLSELMTRWRSYLDERSLLDFASIQARFLERQNGILDQFDHVFVDEFQDTNPIQLAIHEGWLARPDLRLTVVGDDDQSIYRFRGSDIGCFSSLEGQCRDTGVAFRMEKLEQNFRSTQNIIGFAEAYRAASALNSVSMPKTITAPESASRGTPVRLLSGDWHDLCKAVAVELNELGVGRSIAAGADSPPTAAVLLFSTSEKSSAKGPMPALDLRLACELAGLRVYNPRNKVAGRAGSPIFELTALLSYLVDPVTKAPVGKNGRSVEVWAANPNAYYAAAAVTAPAPFPISGAPASIQKKFIKQGGGTIGSPSSVVGPLLQYVDAIREALTAATANRQDPRLTLNGLVARLLSFDYFRRVGFSPALFREAFFTKLMEANIAPTRLTQRSLDQPLRPSRRADNKVEWPQEIWGFLNLFGALIEGTDLDDEEVEAFEENAVALLTFHQAKGLEFDHVYVGLTGRVESPHAVLRTMLFSGESVQYSLTPEGQPLTKDKNVALLAAADRDREVYVAITRAKERLTLLHDPKDGRPLTALNEGLAQIFSDRRRHRVGPLQEQRFEV